MNPFRKQPEPEKRGGQIAPPNAPEPGVSRMPPGAPPSSAHGGLRMPPASVIQPAVGFTMSHEDIARMTDIQWETYWTSLGVSARITATAGRDKPGDGLDEARAWAGEINVHVRSALDGMRERVREVLKTFARTYDSAADPAAADISTLAAAVERALDDPE